MPLRFSHRRIGVSVTFWMGLFLLAAGSFGERVAPSGRRLENLTAYAQLLSTIRFFHPSDEVASADWNRVAVAGVSAIEGAEDPATLARSLEAFFHPLAPTVQVFPAGAVPPLPEALRPAPHGEEAVVAWQHFCGKFDGTSKAFRSLRIDSQSPRFGRLFQAVLPGDLKGRRIRLRARVRAELSSGGRFQLGLRVDRRDGRPGFLDNMADRPIVGTTGWRVVDLEGEVAPDADRIVVLAVLSGQGRVWLDEVSLAPLSGRTKVKLENGGFDSGEVGTEPAGWELPYDSIGAGFHVDLDRGAACALDACAVISSDDVAEPRFGRPYEPLLFDLGGGVSARVPIALWLDEERHTRPRALGPRGPNRWDSIDPAPDTRDNRIAALLLGWGALAHFHATLDLSAAEWIAVLRTVLPEALAAADETDREPFRRAIKHLVVPLHDPVANDVDQKGDPRPAWLPIQWEWLEGQLIITRVDLEIPNLHPGDRVLAIDGRPAGEAIAAAEAVVSGTTEEARRALALHAVRLGAPASAVRLLVQGAAAAPFELSLDRPNPGTAAAPPVAYDPIAEPRPGILYVDLREMRDADFERALPRLVAARGIVFDLRGWSEVTMLLVSHLTERTLDALTWEVPVFQLPYRQDPRFLRTVNRVEPRAPRITAKLTFLADARTFQNGERLLETIASYRFGEIVGARTAGNVGDPNWSDLPGGWTIAWIGRRALTRDGSPLNGVGIEPTIRAARTLAGAIAGRDEVIEQGLAVVGR